MAIKTKLRKILYLSLWLAAGTGLLVLLVAAISKKSHTTCKGMALTIKGGDNLFLDRQDVMNVIAPGKNNPWKGRPLVSFDLHRLEELLKRDVWVKNAQLFFDNNGVLRVNIEERQPVARVFTRSGNSFYIDSSGTHLPLSDKMAIKLPVFTGFPTDNTLLHGADSLLMQQVKQLSLYMLTDSFWLAQVQQVDITDDYRFEMIPVIGHHVIIFGDGTDYESKFHRLLLFYQQVSARLGFDKYSEVNVQYAGQVIGTKKGTISKVDSLQALKNVEALIEASHHPPADTVSTNVDNNITASGVSGSILPVTNAVIPDTLNRAPTQSHPTSMKNRAPFPHPVQKPTTRQKPKAVMKPNN